MVCGIRAITCRAELQNSLCSQSRESRSLRSFLDVGATLLRIVRCAAVGDWWMISLVGVEFLTHENLVTWPTLYFMKPFDSLCQILPEEWLIERNQQVGANSSNQRSPSLLAFYRRIAVVFRDLRDIFVTVVTT